MSAWGPFDIKLLKLEKVIKIRVLYFYDCYKNNVRPDASKGQKVSKEKLWCHPKNTKRNKFKIRSILGRESSSNQHVISQKWKIFEANFF